MKKDKRGLELEVIGKWIIALIILVIIILGIFILNEKGSTILDNLKDMFIFWR
mgnify:CR=1 FL=1